MLSAGARFVSRREICLSPARGQQNLKIVLLSVAKGFPLLEVDSTLVGTALGTLSRKLRGSTGMMFQAMSLVLIIFSSIFLIAAFPFYGSSWDSGDRHSDFQIDDLSLNPL